MEKFIEFSKKYCLKELGIITIVSLIMYFIFTENKMSILWM